MDNLINDINSRLEAVNLQALNYAEISNAEAVETMARIASALGDHAVPGYRYNMVRCIREEHAVRTVNCWGDRPEDAVLYVYADNSGILLTNGYDEVWGDLNEWAAQLDTDALTPAQAQELRESGITVPDYAIAETRQ